MKKYRDMPTSVGLNNHLIIHLRLGPILCLGCSNKNHLRRETLNSYMPFWPKWMQSFEGHPWLWQGGHFCLIFWKLMVSWCSLHHHDEHNSWGFRRLDTKTAGTTSLSTQTETCFPPRRWDPGAPLRSPRRVTVRRWKWMSPCVRQGTPTEGPKWQACWFKQYDLFRLWISLNLTFQRFTFSPSQKGYFKKCQVVCFFAEECLIT